MNILVLVKGAERFCFAYDNASTSELQRILRQYAADESMNFTWSDAAMLSQRARNMSKQDD
ncbi:hypothetical protein [Gimesia fumaroli]|nr:hypothetical protein [Gimesia fumaroli]